MPDLHRRAGGARSGVRVPPAVRLRERRRYRVRRCADRGSVTAETAVVLPVLVLLTLGLAWLLSLGVTQLRVVDAARETARAVARDEPSAVAVGLGRRVAPRGARITITGADAEVRVRVLAGVRGPGGLFRFLPAVDVAAEAVTARERR